MKNAMKVANETAFEHGMLRKLCKIAERVSHAMTNTKPLFVYETDTIASPACFPLAFPTQTKDIVKACDVCVHFCGAASLPLVIPLLCPYEL